MHFTSFKWDLELLGGASKRTQGESKKSKFKSVPRFKGGPKDVLQEGTC